MEGMNRDHAKMVQICGFHTHTHECAPAHVCELTTPGTEDTSLLETYVLI